MPGHVPGGLAFASGPMPAVQVGIRQNRDQNQGRAKAKEAVVKGEEKQTAGRQAGRHTPQTLKPPELPACEPSGGVKSGLLAAARLAKAPRPHFLRRPRRAQQAHTPCLAFLPARSLAPRGKDTMKWEALAIATLLQAQFPGTGKAAAAMARDLAKLSVSVAGMWGGRGGLERAQCLLRTSSFYDQWAAEQGRTRLRAAVGIFTATGVSVQRQQLQNTLTPGVDISSDQRGGGGDEGGTRVGT